MNLSPDGIIMEQFHRHFASRIGTAMDCFRDNVNIFLNTYTDTDIPVMSLPVKVRYGN